MATALLTPAQVKQRFRDRGQTVTAWAKAHGYPRKEVYRVLNGQAKAHFGRAHEIAVALGMKAAESKSTAACSGGNTQSRAAA